MIFFVVDQVAGAEYILPFLLSHPETLDMPYRLFASTVSGTVLARHGIVFEPMDAVDLGHVGALFDRLRPHTCVLSATGNSALEHSFVSAARERGIRSIQFIDNWVNYRARFSFNGAEIFPDRILTLDRKAHELMLAEGISERIITVIGQPYFEFMAANRPEIIPKPRTLLVTQPVARYYGMALGYDEKTFLTEAISAAEAAGIHPSEIDVQIHPAENMAEYQALLGSIATPDATRIRIIHGGSLARYTTVLGMFSSVLVQAVLSGLAVASFQPDAQGADKCFLSTFGYIPRVTSTVELAAFLRQPRPSAGSRELGDTVRGSGARFARLILDSHEHLRAE